MEPAPRPTTPAELLHSNDLTPPARSLQEQLDLVERKVISEALARSSGNKSRAARELGITRNGLALKLRRLGLQ